MGEEREVDTSRPVQRGSETAWQSDREEAGLQRSEEKFGKHLEILSALPDE